MGEVQPPQPSSDATASASTGVFLYNSLTRAREELVLREPGRVSLYVCGVTPYDALHIGHARAFVVYDALRRFLESRGLEVRHVQNVTDVDDKIINRAAQVGTTAQELADRYAAEALVELAQLNVLPAHDYPRVTGHIAPIVSMVQVLEQKEFAYARGGDVYFDVSKDRNYGALSGQKPEELEAGARIEPGEKKDDPLDFALWKGAKPGEPSWESPWGPGRPGWHIECSAMALELLGPAFDIHGGARELLFPHHENERAQSESFLAGEKEEMFARTWWHCGVVQVDGKKMSKSLGNFLSVAAALELADRNEWRLFFLMTHPTSPLDYTPERLAQSQNAWARLYSSLFEARETAEKSEAAVRFEERFSAALCDNLSTPNALAAVFDALSESNRLSDASLAWAVRGALQVLGFTFEPRKADDLGDLAPALIEMLIEVRAQARERRDFKGSDHIRARLAELKIVLEDTPDGTRWKVER
jgi:cysteinyl-tRNA synthetase